MTLPWHLRRLSRMGPRELAGRLRDEALKASWRRLKDKPAVPDDAAAAFGEIPIAPAELGPDATAVDAAVKAGERLLAGRLALFGRDVKLPQVVEDWFVDPDTGTRAPMVEYAFDIDTRDSAVVGNHKFLLESSRLQHASLLASAWFVTGREPFAGLAAAQLQSWWQANPFLSGIHWTSGIELGLRLVAIAWTRRLLKGWTGASAAIEGSGAARAQIRWHQQYLAALGSHGSSANNHRLAELLGLFVGASAFPWYEESGAWRARALAELEVEAERQVFPDGLSREQASDYHGFVLEMLMTAAAEDMAAGRKPAPGLLAIIARMADAWAAVLDCRLRPPRQGDSDEAHGLLIDPVDRARNPASLLAAAAAIVGPAPWWPSVAADIRSSLFAALVRRQSSADLQPVWRANRRPSLFADAGLALLRDVEPRGDELWCRCDHGPHGFLSIAAHAHADALSIELRHGGVDLFADPGTYCYLTELDARRYFRSTLAHNTLEIGGRDQARWGGPFLWLDVPRAELLETMGLESGPIARWTARHAGYARQPGSPVHERTVILDRQERQLTVEDHVRGRGRFAVRLAYHLGPAIEARLDPGGADLMWPIEDGMRRARIILPQALTWRAWRGSQEPMLGWYSPGFGEKLPATSLVGEGWVDADQMLRTVLAIGRS